MSNVVTSEQIELANKLKKLISVYNENKDLILMGGYAPGQDKDLDIAYKKWPEIVEFLKQKPSEVISFENTLSAMRTLLKET